MRLNVFIIPHVTIVLILNQYSSLPLITYPDTLEKSCTLKKNNEDNNQEYTEYIKPCSVYKFIQKYRTKRYNQHMKKFCKLILKHRHIHIWKIWLINESSNCG